MNKKILVIGSTVVDVVISIDELPGTSGDVHIQSQKMVLGGCAYNTCDIIRKAGIPHLLCTPIGEGTYGQFVKNIFQKNGLDIFVEVPNKENGCCYCFVDKRGERTFMSYHGVEYSFDPNWLSNIDLSEFDSVYFCGLEVEEPTGELLVTWLENTKNNFPNMIYYYAPGPRIKRIPFDLHQRIFALNPILHLNEDEALVFTNTCSLEAASKKLYELTKNSLVITWGAKGCYCLEIQNSSDNMDAPFIQYLVEGFPSVVKDTIGAGDSHAGAFIAAQKKGYSFRDSVIKANKVSAAVVSVSGATLSSEKWANLSYLFK
jgi:sugar/nucleoside kinase (ribokinase family)